jgi:hypothetical protein
MLSDEGLHIGDHVVVENHGNQWPHKAQIGVVHANVGQKLLNCYPLRVFSG